jgi:hypothetical protein
VHTIPYVEPRRGASGGTAGQMAAQTAAAAKLPCLPMLQQSQCPFSPLTQEKHFQTLFHRTWPLEYIQLITVHKASSRPILTRWQRSWTNSTRPRTYFGTNINQTNSQEAVYSLSLYSLSSIFYIPYISILSAGQADDVQDRPGRWVFHLHICMPLKFPLPFTDPIRMVKVIGDQRLAYKTILDKLEQFQDDTCSMDAPTDTQLTHGYTF